MATIMITTIVSLSCCLLFFAVCSLANLDPLVQNLSPYLDAKVIIRVSAMWAWSEGRERVTNREVCRFVDLSALCTPQLGIVNTLRHSNSSHLQRPTNLQNTIRCSTHRAAAGFTIHTHTHTHTHQNTHNNVQPHKHACTCIHTTYMHTGHACTCMYMHMHNMCMYMHMYIHAYIPYRGYYWQWFSLAISTHLLIG
jgi:hypothetical protein